MEPLDYTSSFANLPSPGQAFVQGVQGGVGIQQLQMQQAQQAYQMQRMRQMQAASMQVAQNPTPAAISQLSIAFPEMSESYKRSFDMLTPTQQQAKITTASQVYAAAQSGRPDLAAQLLRDQATALTNSGDVQNAKAASTMADWAEQHPESFKTSAGLMLSAAMGPEKFAQTFSDLGNVTKQATLLPAEAQKAQAEASIASAGASNAPTKNALENANVQSQIDTRAGQLGVDRDKLMSEMQVKLRELALQYGTPPEDARKLINEAAITAAGSDQSAAKLEDLATRMQASGDGSGVASTGNELYKKLTGHQDGLTSLRQEYTRLVNSSTLKSMKDSVGGRVTDTDLKAAMDGMPPATADATQTSAFLRGMAKLQRIDSAVNNAQSEWLSQVRHLGKTNKDIEVMGTKVPEGTTFADFSRQFAQQKAEQIGAQSALVKSQNRGYMRFAQPLQGDPNATPAPGTPDASSLVPGAQ